MSHVTTLAVVFENRDRLCRALDSLGWEYERNGTHKFYFDREPKQGLKVQVPGWYQPAIVAGDGEKVFYDEDYSLDDFNPLRVAYARLTVEEEAIPQLADAGFSVTGVDIASDGSVNFTFQQEAF